MSRGKLVKVAAWIEDNLVVYAQQFGPILVAAAGVWWGLWWPEAYKAGQKLSGFGAVKYWCSDFVVWFSALSVAYAGCGAYFGVKNDKVRQARLKSMENNLDELSDENTNLRNELEDLIQTLDEVRTEYQETLKDMSARYLGYLFSDVLRLGNDERVSLYVHDNKQFIIVGRYSKHPDFKTINRLRFPDNEGCVSEAWLSGNEVFAELPVNHKDYIDVLSDNYNISRVSSKKIRMKSRSYYVKAIENSRHRIGVIVFESKKHGRLDAKMLRVELDKQQSYIYDVLERAKQVNSFILYQGGE